MANVEQAQQMFPLITCEISFVKNVSELVFGVGVFDLDLRVQIDSVKQTNQEQLSESWTRVSSLDFCI